MALRGTLNIFSLAQLLNLIRLATKTGTLYIYEPIETGKTLILGDGITEVPEVASGAEIGAFYFKEGKLLYARVREKSDTLTDILRHAGHLNEVQAKVIQERGAHHSDKALALLLISSEYLSKENLIRSIQDYVVNCVFNIAARESNQPFEFTETVNVFGDKIMVPIELGAIIVKINNFRENTKKLEERIPNLDLNLKFVESPSEKFRDVQLSTTEWRVVSFINPKNSIKQIAKACRLNDFEIRQAVATLLDAGLIELGGLPRVATQRRRPGEQAPYKLAHHERILWNHFREALCVYHTTENEIETWYILAVWQDQQTAFQGILATKQPIPAETLGYVLDSGEGAMPPNDAFDRALAEQNPVEVDAHIYKHFKGWLKEELQSRSKSRPSPITAKLIEKLKNL